jgi:threonine/homoserine/homoserine lactone efflux protein
MFSLFMLFISSSLISFMGSLHPGTVNVMVARTVLTHGLRPGIRLGIGGVIPEFIYAVIACFLFQKLSGKNNWLEYAGGVAIPVFLLLGIILWRSDSKMAIPESKDTNSGLINFGHGFLFGIFNPQLLPFWFAVLTFLDGFIRIQTWNQWVVFSAGSALGAFMCLYLLARYTERKKERILLILNRFPADKIIGSFFIFLALLKILTLLLPET